MTFIDSVITGIATGLGCAVGTWIAQRNIIRNLEKFEQELKKMVKK